MRLRMGIYAWLLLILSISTLALGTYALNKVYRGNVVEIRGRVVDELGRGVSNAVVQLKDGATILASTKSGSDGSFIIKWNVPSSYPLGSKTLTLYVPEQSSIYVEESSTSIEMEIWDKTTLKLNSIPKKIHRGDVVTISGTLTVLGSGDPVSGVTIAISYGQSELGSTRTSKDGRFSISFKVPKNWNRGPITIIAEFPGSPTIYLDGSKDSTSTALWIKPTIQVKSVTSG